MKRSACFFSTLLILLAISGTTSAQYPKLLWSKHFPSDAITQDFTANDIIEASNGDYVIAGSMTELDKSVVYVTRINSEGDTVWSRTYPATDLAGNPYNEDALAITQIENGNFCVVGYRIVEPSAAGQRARTLIMEIDALGKKLDFNLVGRTYAWSEAHSIKKTANNRYILTGLNRYSGVDSIFIASLDIYPYPGLDSLRVFTCDGSPGWGDWATQTEDGTVIAGSTIKNKFDFFLMKTQFFGDPAWTHTYGHDENDQLSDVVALDDGYFLVGYAEVDVPYGGNVYERPQVYVVRTELNGQVIWEKTYGGINTHYANAACLTEDGNLMVIGTQTLPDHSTEIFLYKIAAANGDSIWQKKYMDNISAAARVGMSTSDFGYVVAGQNTTGQVNAEKMIYMMRLSNSDGTTSHLENRSDLNKDISGAETHDIIQVNLLQTEIFGINCYIDTLLHPSVGDLELVLEHAGRTISLVNRPPNSGENFINTLFIDLAEIPIDDGEAPYTGIFRPEDSLGLFNGLDPNGDWILGIIDHSQKKSLKTGEKILDSWGIRFLVEGEPGTGIEPVGLLDQPMLQSVYPNPFRDEATISFNLPRPSHVSLSIYDVQGRHIEKLIDQDFLSGTLQCVWKATGHPAGAYIIRFKAGNTIEFRKIVLSR
ncbi:MAG: T9SS type A sorting domain-containing protein [Bacteroidales bacterium]|nr:T9SS type A sorting domain-containing protein [Bacteroidales bacterium]